MISLVIFSPAGEVKNGDNCFVRYGVPHQTSFNRVFFEKGKKVRLQPENVNYSPIIIDADDLDRIYKAVIKIERLG